MGAFNRLHMGEMSEMASKVATLEELLAEQAKINTQLLRLMQDGASQSEGTTSNGTTTTTTTDPETGETTDEQSIIDTAAQGRVVIKFVPGEMHPWHWHPHVHPPHDCHRPFYPVVPPPPPFIDMWRVPVPPPAHMIPYPYTRAYWTYRY